IVIALEIVRSRFTAQIAVNALVIHVIITSGIFWVSVRDISHSCCVVREYWGRCTAKARLDLGIAWRVGHIWTLPAKRWGESQCHLVKNTLKKQPFANIFESDTIPSPMASYAVGFCLGVRWLDRPGTFPPVAAQLAPLEYDWSTAQGYRFLWHGN